MIEFEQRILDMEAFRRGEMSVAEAKARSELRRKAAGKTPAEWQREVSADARRARALRAALNKGGE